MTAQEDPELTAMSLVLKAVEGLDSPEAQQRVLSWVGIRLGLNVGAPGPKGSQEGKAPAGDVRPPREGTVSTVATKLGVSSCRTLLLAAAAYLVLYRGKEKFSREELVSCAKDARAWRSDYVTQTSVNINRMCDAGELIEKSKDVYDLAPKKLAELEPKLSG
jgi:hypothetical protein